MDSETIARRQAELNKIKKGLKDWEHGFLKSHKRKPTIKDIQDRPKVERVYKDYHAKKKELLRLSKEVTDSQSLSQPIPFDSQQQKQHLDSQNTKVFSPSSSQPLSPSQKRRRGSQASVEYIRSPSHRLSRIKYVDQLELPTTSLDFGTKPSSEPVTPSARSASTDADDFWLSGCPSSSRSVRIPSSDNTTTTTPVPDQDMPVDSSSGNTPSIFSLTDNGATHINRSTSSRRKKKNAALEQKLFGHLIWKPRDTLSPALKAERDSSSQPTTPTTPLDSQTSLADASDLSAESSVGTMVNDLKIDGLLIAEHDQDPFRHFDPELRNHLEDPDRFVMPGLFASARARSTIMAPMMNDDRERYNRILDALRHGTLGEKRRDDDDIGTMDEGLKRFMDENTDTFADPTDTAAQDEPAPTYRKKFTQKRQTRLHKFKYVETSPSSL